jgi:hypothetical protein
MRVYREVLYEMQMILDICMALERHGFTYRKDFDVRTAPYSIYLDDRKCSVLYFANKRTYAMWPILREEWNVKDLAKQKKASRLAKLRATLAAKKAAKES